ncbi:MAG TPA: hypothetical protein DCP53_06665 [Elusimicrobia bacterium]|nr:hypothetical protein [Elusimicrobiota bacterium]
MVKKLDFILYYGLIVFAFVLPISIAATNIVWVVLLLVWIIKIIIKKSENFYTPLNYPISIFLIITVVFSIFGLNFFKSMKGMNSELLFIVFFIIAINVKDFQHVKKIAYFFLISSALTGLLGLWQYFSGQNLYDNVIYGKTANLISMFNFRAHGTRSWMHTYAEGLLMALPIGVSFLIYSKKRIIYYFIIGLIVSGIVLSYVRMAWIATVIIFIIMFFILIRRKKNINLSYLLIPLILIAFSSVFLPKRGNIIKRAIDFKDPIRINMWKTSVAILKDYPIFGTGMKNIKTIFPEYYEKLGLDKEYYKLSHLHNTYLHISVERGILGLIIFLSVFGFYFYYGIRKAKYINNFEKYFVIGCLLGILGFMITGLTEHVYGDSEVKITAFFLMALTFYKSKAVFFDRDGTINEDVHYLSNVKDLRIFEKSASAIKLLNDSEFKIIIVTNQSGIARGYFTLNDVKEVNEVLVNKLKENNAYVNTVYVCPHHPDEECFCRKPKPRMLYAAKRDLNIDLKESYVVGDKQCDIDLAKNINIKSVLVLSGQGENVKGADYVAKDILDAAEWIIKNENEKK